MQTAAFSISNYQFDKISIDFSNCKNKKLSLNFNVKGIYIEENSTYKLTFILNVFNDVEKDNSSNDVEKDNSSNDVEKDSFITIRCIGTFVFENVSDITKIPDFFYKNSIAILFPYVRAYVSLITTQANFPGIILPTLNLSELGNILKENTTKK